MTCADLVPKSNRSRNPGRGDSIKLALGLRPTRACPGGFGRIAGSPSPKTTRPLHLVPGLATTRKAPLIDSSVHEQPLFIATRLGLKAVGHLDANCFFASAERVRDTFPRQMLVEMLGNQGACVIAGSYEMKAAGSRRGRPSGMPW